MVDWTLDANFTNVLKTFVGSNSVALMKSVLFGGTDEYATGGDILNFDYNVPFSLSCWFKTAYTDGWQVLISKALNNGVLEGYTLDISATGIIYFWLVDEWDSSALRAGYNPGTDYRDGFWHNIVATYDGSADFSGVGIIVDGVNLLVVNSRNTLSSSTLTTRPFQIGARNGADRFFVGNIDEPAVWDKELSVVEAQEVYNSGNPDDLSAHSAAANLVGWWRMGDGDTFPTLQDQIASNDITLVNMAAEDIVLFDSPGSFSIHDSGQTYMDAGELKSWDFSTVANTLTGTPTITYQYATNNTGTPPTYPGDYSSALTIGQLAAETDNDDRYMWITASIDGVVTDSFDQFSMDTYSMDVTPPGVATALSFKRIGTNNYSAAWTDPVDVDFSHCELRRDLAGVTKLLGKTDSLPAWEDAPGTFWTFAEGDVTKDSQFSNYTDEDVAAGNVAYYVRSVDTNDNKSAWTLIPSQAGGGALGLYSSVYSSIA
jgi:hypothetical protein